MRWDGFSIMGWMKRTEETARIPVIVITSSDPAQVKDKALALASDLPGLAALRVQALLQLVAALAGAGFVRGLALPALRAYRSAGRMRCIQASSELRNEYTMIAMATIRLKLTSTAAMLTVERRAVPRSWAAAIWRHAEPPSGRRWNTT